MTTYSQDRLVGKVGWGVDDKAKREAVVEAVVEAVDQQDRAKSISPKIKLEEERRRREEGKEGRWEPQWLSL